MSDVDFAERRFEATRQRILRDLEDAIDACVQPREFHALIGRLTSLQEDVLQITPGVEADRQFSSWSNIAAAFRRADIWSWIALLVSLIGGLVVGATFRAKIAALEFIGSAYAATTPVAVDPAVLLAFQWIVTAMLPLLAVGAFGVLIFGKTPESRKAGKELLIGIAGFFLGAATRLIS